jgi:hypothetical protein
MREIDFSTNTMKGQSERLSREARQWIVPLARFGFGAQRVVYIIICSLAALTASHHGGRTSGSQGAPVEICLSRLGPYLGKTCRSPQLGRP